jgi:ectoine hydroxylase-related dioxygenase (phytanoyl-CoA dioxygenase family)
LTYSIDDFNQTGFMFIPKLVDSALCHRLADDISEDDVSPLKSQGGVRHLIDSTSVLELLRHTELRQVVQTIVSPSAFAYKATLFDKHLEANWLSAWHQDTLIPVASAIDSHEWSRWSIKEGVTYAHPPKGVLERIVALRIHLDDCTADNGALRVREGSHLQGAYRSTDVSSATANHLEHIITGSTGSALLMRPLLVHASSKAATPARRRVLHIEFADFDLPDSAIWVRRYTL